MKRLGGLGAGLYRIMVREWLSHINNDPIHPGLALGERFAYSKG